MGAEVLECVNKGLRRIRKLRFSAEDLCFFVFLLYDMLVMVSYMKGTPMRNQEKEIDGITPLGGEEGNQGKKFV